MSMTRSFMPVLMVAAGLASAAVSLPASAQFAKPEDAIKYRRAAFTLMSTHFGRVAAMANRKVPFDAKAVADNAELATIMSKLPCAAFVDGSDKGDTPAEPKI
jgi:cytochrome c556